MYLYFCFVVTPGRLISVFLSVLYLVWYCLPINLSACQEDTFSKAGYINLTHNVKCFFVHELYKLWFSSERVFLDLVLAIAEWGICEAASYSISSISCSGCNRTVDEFFFYSQNSAVLISFLNFIIVS